MATFLFWNIRRQKILDHIVVLAHTYNVDVIILAESNISADSLQMALNENQSALYFPDPGFSTQLQIYTRYLYSFFKPIRDMGGIAIRHLIPPVGRDILLVIVHLPSKIYQKEYDQVFACIRLANIITEDERKVGHTRTVLIGDLNMDPFEHGIVGADGLHGLSDRRIVKKGFRNVGGENRIFFYNPMWNYFGDMNSHPPGTYFFDTGKQVNLYWHMFDQVLVRPDLLDSVRKESVKIITEVAGVSLLNNSGRPDTKIGSDHLPIIFTLDLSERNYLT